LRNQQEKVFVDSRFKQNENNQNASLLLLKEELKREKKNKGLEEKNK